MWLRVEHRTTFSYETPVAEAQLELRLKPASDAGQRCYSFELAVSPGRASVFTHADAYGNTVQALDVLEPHTQLVITTTSEVATTQRLDDERPLPLLERHAYLAPTELVSTDGAV